jgi:hypothetical protein
MPPGGRLFPAVPDLDMDAVWMYLTDAAVSNASLSMHITIDMWMYINDNRYQLWMKTTNKPKRWKENPMMILVVQALDWLWLIRLLTNYVANLQSALDADSLGYRAESSDQQGLHWLWHPWVISVHCIGKTGRENTMC